jgi:hypothetical protein
MGKYRGACEMLKSPQEGLATRPYFAYKIFGPAPYRGGSAALAPRWKIEKISARGILRQGGTTLDPEVCLPGPKILQAVGRHRG